MFVNKKDLEETCRHPPPPDLLKSRSQATTQTKRALDCQDDDVGYSKQTRQNLSNFLG
jgi:hypothetical protein